MALEQLNLKLPPEVLAHWRALAAAEGLSVRDWLIARLAPAAAAGPELGERVEALEAAVALLQAQPPRSPDRVSPAPRSGELPSPERVEPLRVPLGAGTLEIIGTNHFRADPPDQLEAADGIETAALAELLGVKRGTFNAAVKRAGGPRPGLVLEGWRCVGLRSPERGGPPRALWVPDRVPDRVPAAGDRVPADG